MDERLRDLERRAMIGDLSDKATFLHALVHAGVYTTKEIEAMAWLGLPAALLIFPKPRELFKKTKPIVYHPSEGALDDDRPLTRHQRRAQLRDLLRVEEFISSEFLRKTTPKWIDVENQVIERLSKQHGVELAFLLFEKFLLPKAVEIRTLPGQPRWSDAQTISECNCNLGESVQRYLIAAKRHMGLTTMGPLLYRYQFEGLRRLISDHVWQHPPSIPRHIALEIVTALHLDSQTASPRRLFYTVSHAIARIGDIEVSQGPASELRKPESDRYKFLIVDTIRDFLVPLAVR